METIATLDALRQHIGFSPTDTSDDSRLQAALWAALKGHDASIDKPAAPPPKGRDLSSGSSSSRSSAPFPQKEALSFSTPGGNKRRKTAAAVPPSAKASAAGAKPAITPPATTIAVDSDSESNFGGSGSNLSGSCGSSSDDSMADIGLDTEFDNLDAERAQKLLLRYMPRLKDKKAKARISWARASPEAREKFMALMKGPAPASKMEKKRTSLI